LVNSPRDTRGNIDFGELPLAWGREYLMRYVSFCALVVLVLLTGLSVVQAQTETGQITGTVVDQTGALVPGAKVTVKSLETGSSRSLVTTSSGVYVVPNLLPGVYQVSVEASGFATAQRQATVTVGSRIGLDISLAVGQTGTVVEVSEAAAVINTETQTLGATISQHQLIELPTITRDPYALIGTVGNVSSTDPSMRGAGYAINGQRSSATNVMLDGTSNNDEFTASRGQTIPLDSVQEFSVLTSNFTAEFGRASAGVVNVATKAGTNEFHGSAYEFGRYSRLASNDFDSNANGIPKQVFTRNQFGYSIGGPAIKNKLFFFNNTEWIRVRSQATQTVWVPTSNFIGVADHNTQNFFSTYGALRSNLSTLGNFSKADFLGLGYDVCKGLAATSKCAALPSNLPLFSRVNYGYPADSGGGSPQDTYMTVGRVDYNLSEKTQMYVRYALYNENDFPGTVSNSPYQGYDSPNTQVNNSVVYSLTRVFSPRLVSQSKVDFNRFNNQQPFSGHGAVPTLYLGSASVATSILGNNVAMPGYLPYGPGLGIPFGGPQNYIQAYEDLSYIVNKHNIRFGGTYTYLRDNRTFGAYETAIEVLGSNVPRGMEGFLNGTLYQFQAAVNPQGKFPCGAKVTPDCTLTLPVGPPNFSRSNRYHDWGLYLQDSWKVTPRFTLNYGVRWEVFGTQHNKNANLDSNYYLGAGGDIYNQIANGYVATVPNSPDGRLWKTNYGNVGPRVGFAWDIFGDGKTSLRAGYGVYYERNFGNVTFNVIQNPPNYSVLSLFGGVDLPVIPVSVDNAGPLGGSEGSKPLGRVSLRAVDPNIKTAYVGAWSAALEHRFGQGIIVALEYSGSDGENQYGIANINRTASGPYYLGTPCDVGIEGDFGTCGARLRSTQYSNINYRTNGGFSKYNAANVRVEIQNVAHSGVDLRANYTWSHAIDTLSDTFSSSANQVNLGWLDPFNPGQDKGDAYYDLRHRVNISAIWTIPYKSDNKLARMALGGWGLIPNFTAYTGSPFSLYDCTYGFEACPYAMFSGKAPKTGTPVATGTPNIYDYINVSNIVDSSFYNPTTALSQYGPFPSNMIGRNFFRGPGYWNMDFAIHKSFNFSERMRLQLRGEFFNVFNHSNLYANIGDNDVSSIGSVTASYGVHPNDSLTDRRQVQLGVRFDF
jgi:hypothetical protein